MTELIVAYWRGFGAVGTLLAALSCAERQDDSDTVTVGLTLPYSGMFAAISANFEQPAIYAVDRVNAAGRIRNERLRIASADTHCSPSRSVESAKRLISEGAAVVIGIESSDTAATLEPMFDEQGVTLLSPFMGTADGSPLDCVDRWFRLPPAASTIGNALAKELAPQQVPSVVVLSESDAYSHAFSSAAVDRFTSPGDTVALHLELGQTAENLSAVLAQTMATQVPNLVFSAAVRNASLLVNEFRANTSQPINWYLSPVLKTPLLIHNIIADALNGTRGVAPKTYETADTFCRDFQRRWEGDQPLERACFYYDAVAIVAYALQVSLLSDGGPISAEAFKQSVMRTTFLQGEAMRWNEIERGQQGLQVGRQFDYTRVTGPILLDACGARKVGTFGTWQVQDGRIVNDITN